MTVIGIARITVSVAELDRALALYRDALGLLVLYQQPGRAMLQVPAGPQWQLHVRSPQPTHFGVTASLQVDDVDATTRAALGAGATKVSGPADEPWGERQAVLLDPDGHVLCLVSPLATTSG